MRTYYTLVERDAPGELWTIQFGDYDPDTVKAERDDFRDHGVRAKNLKIIRTTSDKWTAIEAAVARLNLTTGAIFERPSVDPDGYDRDNLGESPDF